jgi:hypothetical protein
MLTQVWIWLVVVTTESPAASFRSCGSRWRRVSADSEILRSLFFMIGLLSPRFIND